MKISLKIEKVSNGYLVEYKGRKLFVATLGELNAFIEDELNPKPQVGEPDSNG